MSPCKIKWAFEICIKMTCEKIKRCLLTSSNFGFVLLLPKKQSHNLLYIFRFTIHQNYFCSSMSKYRMKLCSENRLLKHKFQGKNALLCTAFSRKNALHTLLLYVYWRNGVHVNTKVCSLNTISTYIWHNCLSFFLKTDTKNCMTLVLHSREMF